jgi:excisionase family DNA binding protein
MTAASDPSAAPAPHANYCLTTLEAAQYLGLSKATLEVWRLRAKRGEISHAPPYAKLGRLVRYSRADLDAWQRSNVVAVHPARASS